jgi:hypothetical protein
LSVFTCRNYIPENAPEVINVDDLPENNQIGETTEDGIAFQYPEGGGISAILVRQSDISRLNPSHLRPVDKFLSDTLHCVDGFYSKTPCGYRFGAFASFSVVLLFLFIS